MDKLLLKKLQIITIRGESLKDGKVISALIKD